MIEKLTKIICEHTGNNDITITEDTILIADLGLNSLDLVNLACIVEDESSWGYCISPVQFAEIAMVYELKFSKAVYTAVCERFAAKNFGSSAYDVDEFFLATGKDILSCLLEG